MDRRLLRYYDRELAYLRQMGGEFAREFPKVAGRLGLDELACADPYVERLLEGFAFLTARVQLKLDSEFSRFTQNLLETVYPHFLAPTPSMAVVHFQPDLAESSLADGYKIARGMQLRSLLGKDEQTACLYRTAHEVTLWPLEVAEAAYLTRELGALKPPEHIRAKAALRIRLRCHGGKTFDKIKLEDLVIHLRGTAETPFRLCEQVLGRAVAVVVRGAAGNAVNNRWHAVEGPRPVSPVGYDEDQALLPGGARSFSGYRLLREYFSFPHRFLFARLNGLGKALRATKDREADILIMFSAEDRELENAVDAGSIALFCTPAVNLFPRRADRIHITDRSWEFHVVPDRTRPLDYEVFQVQSVTAFGAGGEAQQTFRPFYAAGADHKGDGGAYFAVTRLPRTPAAKEARVGRRSSYAGGEAFISLVDAAAAPYRSDHKQLGVECLCTNRDLPLQMPVGRGRTDFTTETAAPVQAVRVVAGPTPPRASFAEGEIAWRLISHMSLNYLSLADSDERQGAAALRDLLKLYIEPGDPQSQKQVEGVRSVSSRPISRQVPGGGPIAFARGLEVELTLDEPSFEGTGIFVLGAVLSQFFSRYVSINSFTETVVKAAQRGEVMRWPARPGLRQMF
ncbi:MAG: type VI secretion system baseplate subunit TssF [Phycisphaerales bacterium]